MTLAILNILKQFGGVVIVWIKKLLKSLYGSIILRITLAVIISCVLVVLLLTATTQYSVSQNKKFWEANSTAIEEIASEIKSGIDTQNLTYKQAKEQDYSNLEDEILCTISFYSSYSDIFNDVDYLYEVGMLGAGYFFEISFADGTGFMVVYSEKIVAQTDVLIILSFVIGISLFFILSLCLIFKKLSYIKVIEKGIFNISHGDINYKIPIKGENELTRLATSINDMGDMLLQKIEQERNHEANQRLLITNMSHDLKTPLTSMTGYIDVIESKMPTDHELYPMAVVAKKNGQRLEKLISDLFLYSKLLSKDVTINMQKINLNVMLKQILEIRTEKIVLNEKDTNLSAYIDPEKFHRIMDNLISNAAKYGLENEDITVNIGSKNNEVVLEVENLTHENVAANLDKLTNRLYTASEDRTNGSSGLGLSIVTELLNVMDGKLELAFKNNVFKATVYLAKI